MTALRSRRQFLATSAGARALAPAEPFRMGRLDHDSFRQIPQQPGELEAAIDATT